MKIYAAQMYVPSIALAMKFSSPEVFAISGKVMAETFVAASHGVSV